jgi:hypothetical protein
MRVVDLSGNRFRRGYVLAAALLTGIVVFAATNLRRTCQAV